MRGTSSTGSPRPTWPRTWSTPHREDPVTSCGTPSSGSAESARGPGRDRRDDAARRTATGYLLARARVAGSTHRTRRRRREEIVAGLQAIEKRPLVARAASTSAVATERTACAALGLWSIHADTAAPS